MEKEILNKAKAWLSSPIDEDTRHTIQSWIDDNNENELAEAFYKDLEFGTGGLRGIMGVGSNRINKYTIGMATQGLANYLKSSFTVNPIKVAIAYDSRNNSQYLANITADVLSANGIKVYIYPELRPTPQLSFTIRHLGCQAGIVLTASHNPKEYNGYKAYWEDGAQMVPPHDVNVIKEVQKIEGIAFVPFKRNKDLIEYIGVDADKAYRDMVASLSVKSEVINRQKDLKIVFSPIHGTGVTQVPQVLKQIGFEQVTVVEAQAKPDGDFPTVVYPNPEESNAMEMALNTAKNLDADLVMATDPDADRVGIAIKNPQGNWELLNGNQTGSLLLYYLLTAWKESGKLNGKQYLVKTIVTTDLIHKIARDFGVNSYDTLTGFKYIAEVIREKENEYEFIAGGEESYGYLVGAEVRDKDAVSSCAIIAEMTAYAKDQGKTLFDFLAEMYLKYGFYEEKLVSVTRKGRSGSDEIAAMMTGFREKPPAELAGSRVVKIIDYKIGKEKSMLDGKESFIDFPSSNVIQLIAEDGTKMSARPSGTEPKIKFYFSVNTPILNVSDFVQVKSLLNEKIDKIINEFNL